MARFSFLFFLFYRYLTFLLHFILINLHTISPAAGHRLLVFPVALSPSVFFRTHK